MVMLGQSSEESLQAKLVQCIQDSLAHFMLPNAIFLAERLHASANSDYSRNVLATCFYRSNKPQKAYTILKPHLTTPENRYLFALCCYDLAKYQEAEVALITTQHFIASASQVRKLSSHSSKQITNNKPTQISDDVPNGSAGLLLLGQVYKRRGQKNRAIQALVQALELNPFLFQAFQLLSDLGKCPDLLRRSKRKLIE
jgi:anaphase-promoting complex subunit 3